LCCLLLVLRLVRCVFLLILPPPRSTLFPYTTLFRSWPTRSSSCSTTVSMRPKPCPRRSVIRCSPGSSTSQSGCDADWPEPARRPSSEPAPHLVPASPSESILRGLRGD